MSNVFFDWYRCTIPAADPEHVLDVLRAKLDLVDISGSKPLDGYRTCRSVVRGSDTICRVMWGGNPGVNVLSTGENAHDVAMILRGDFPDHFCSRVDSRIDWVLSGLFDNCAAALLHYAHRNGIRYKQIGGWHTGEARTLYLHGFLGEICLYEKGYQMGGDPNWVRLECRSTPQKKPEKLQLAKSSPDQVLSFSKWARQALKYMGLDALSYKSVKRPAKTDDMQRSRYAVVRQYGGILNLWAQELGGWENLGPAIESEINRQRLEREAIEAASVCPDGVPADVWARAQREIQRQRTQRGLTG